MSLSVKKTKFNSNKMQGDDPILRRENTNRKDKSLLAKSLEYTQVEGSDRLMRAHAERNNAVEMQNINSDLMMQAAMNTLSNPLFQ